MSAPLSAFRSFLAALPPKTLQKCSDTGDTSDTGAQGADSSSKLSYHPTGRHGDTGDTNSAAVSFEGKSVSPVSPAENDSDTEKNQQNQWCITCITGITPKTSICEPGAEQITPLPGIDALEERAALIAEGCGISQDEAAGRAATELGFADAEAFYAAHLAAWREAAAASRPLEQDRAGGALLKVKASTLDFLSSPHALEAVRCGWGGLALFGVHEGPAPLERLDARGLIPLIAWTATGLKLESISRLNAGLTNARGTSLNYPRFRHSLNESVAWWQHPRFGASTATAQTKGT